jgi:predicted ATP-dependent endonuclease of OLD family
MPIPITNFRCFKSYRVEFASGFTVLVGKNGAGKTTLINAIKHGLSFIFSKDKKFVVRVLLIMIFIAIKRKKTQILRSALSI